jgi:hypothetical protein
MIEAFNLILKQMPDAKLVIAGGDHPQAAGYTESVKQQCAGNDRIEFLGYVPEDALPALFQSASVAVMPYSSSTGCSGVAHLACAYGVPIVCADLADFRQMAQGEELAMEFYPPGNVHGLADCLLQLMQDPTKLRSMATRNFSAGLRMTMPNVVQKYLRHFELQQRVQTLKYVAHIRRLPRWMPSKALLLRFMTRNSLGWARRSAVLHASWSDRDDLRLLHSNGNARGKLNGAGTALNGDGVASSSGGGSGRGAGSSSGRGAGSDIPPAGNGSGDHHAQNTSAHKGSDAFVLGFSDDRGAEQPETEQPRGEQGTVRLALVDPGNFGGGNGENGVGAARAGNNSSGRERTGQIGGQAGALQSNRIIEGP